MTPRDNLLSTLRRTGYEEVPMDISLCASQEEHFKRETGSQSVAEFFRLPHRTLSVALEGPPDPRALYPREDLPEQITFDEWGVGHSSGSEAAYHMTKLHYPLRGAELAEIETFPMPKIDEDAELDRVSGWVRRTVDNGHLAVVGMSQTIWERAWAIRSMEDLFVDMAMGDEKATTLLDKVTDVAVRRAQIAAEAGVDMIHLGDDIGMQSTPMMSIDMWREWLKPRLSSVINAAKSIKPGIIIFYHSCGYVLPFIDELIELGVEVLNPVQPESMSFEEVHSRWGERLSFWGAIGTQQLMPFGSAEEVRAEIRRNVAICGEKGGYVVAPTHLVEPEVPWENIMAVRETCDELSA